MGSSNGRKAPGNREDRHVRSGRWWWALALCWPSSPVFAAAPGVSIAWTAPSPCPSEAEVVQEVDRLLSSQSAVEPNLLAHGRVVRNEPANQWELELTLSRGDTRATRSMHHDDCSVLARSAAFVVAVAVDPTLVPPGPEQVVTDSPSGSPLHQDSAADPTTAPATDGAHANANDELASTTLDPPLQRPGNRTPGASEASNALAEASTPATPAGFAPAPAFERNRSLGTLELRREVAGAMEPTTNTVTSAVPPPRRRRGQLQWGAMAGATAGALPGFGWGVSALLEHSWPRLLLGAELTYWAPRRVELDSELAGRAYLQLATVGVRTCWQPHTDRFAFPLCAGASTGAVWARADEQAIASNVAAVTAFGGWFDARLTAGVRWHITRLTALALRAEAAFPMVRPFFAITGVDGPVGRVGVLDARAFLGVTRRLGLTARAGRGK